jgi:hypothetical protein
VTVRSGRGTSLLVVGEQSGEGGKAALALLLLPPLPPPDPGLWAGVSGVSGGEGERLLCRRMDGSRNLRSPRRRGGVSTARGPLAELAGEIKGVGDPAGGTSRAGPLRERRAWSKDALRRFRHRSQTRAKVTSSISARTEQIATAAFP